jgi:hypothetical protein
MVHETWPFDKEMLSHKHNRAGVMYKIAVGVFNGKICWINGAYKASVGDKDVFALEGLGDSLLEWEMVEYDLGY